MGLIKFLKLVQCVSFFNARGTASHMIEEEYLNLHVLAIQVPVDVSHLVKFLLLGLPIFFLLISNFFSVGGPFASVDLNLRTSASVAHREVIGQIQLPAPAALDEPLQSLQATRLQTDDKHNVVLQRLGKD